MLKFAVLLAAFICAVQAQDGTKPTPNPKSCRIDYLKDACACVNVPKLLTNTDFQKCGDDKRGKGRRFHHGNPDVEWRSGGAGGGPESDAAPGDGTLEAQRQAPEGKRRRGKREPHRGGKRGRSGKYGKKGGNCNFNCKMECVFNSSGLLDASGNIDIAAVHTNFEAKAPNAPWTELVKSSIDACWADVQNAPIPTTPAPSTDAPTKKVCKQQSVLLLQCINRALFINAPESERNANSTVADCDARVAQLKGCDPMVPGFMNWGYGKMNKGGSEEDGGAGAFGAFSKMSKKMRQGAKSFKLRMSRKRATTAAPADN